MINEAENEAGTEKWTWMDLGVYMDTNILNIKYVSI